MKAKNQKKRCKRPQERSEAPKALVTMYDSMTACTAATGIPMAVLKWAKRSGAPAFRWNRVFLDRLLAWPGLWNRGNALLDPVQERARETVERRKLLELERRRLEDDLFPRAEVYELIRRCAQPVSQVIRDLPSSMAARTNPGDPPFARAALDQWVAEALALIHDPHDSSKAS